MAEIQKTDDRTWIFEDAGVRFFLLTGTKRALLIDSGMVTHNAKELAEQLTDLPISLLNTHADPDHIGSNGEFPSFYMHPAEATNYYNSQGGTGEIIPVWDGDIIDLGDRPLQIIEIPGHTPGSIAVLDGKRLFSGDPIQDDKIFMFGIQREMHAYRLSLLKLKKYRFEEIYPSHGTCPVHPELIDLLYEAAGNVMAGKVPGIEIEMFGKPVTAYDVGVATFLCDKK